MIVRDNKLSYTLLHADIALKQDITFVNRYNVSVKAHHSLQYLTLFLPRAFCCGYEHASLLPLSLRAWYLPYVTQNSDLLLIKYSLNGHAGATTGAALLENNEATAKSTSQDGGMAVNFG